MQIKEIIIPNSRLIEGSYHTFKILRHQQFSTVESYFVMLDPLGYKLLMPSGYYKEYGFKEGEEVLCRVDRINCSGRMFLEPVHPYYKEGEWYDFGVIKSGWRPAITGATEYFVTVGDNHQREWDVRLAHEMIPHPDNLRCRVERIKKGRFYLSSPWQANEGLTVGEQESFILTGENISPFDNLRYYILSDSKGNLHIMPKRYYLHYRLKKNQSVQCVVGEVNLQGYHLLEPLNPWYKKGEEYEFELLELQRLIFSDGSYQDVAVIDDPYNEPVKIFIDNELTMQLVNLRKVKGRVTGFRKSRPELLITGGSVL